MIHAIDQELSQWVATVWEDCDFSLDAPSEGEQPAINIYLMDLLPASRSTQGRRMPLQVNLRYLVSVADATIAQAHEALGQLVFAAMENDRFEVELGPVPAQLWRSFNVPPRPAFWLRVPMIMQRPEPVIGLITQPVRVGVEHARALRGVVTNQNAKLLPGVLVELPELQVSTRTDRRGRFEFGALPAEPVSKALRLSFKGISQTLAVEHRVDDIQTCIFQFSRAEEE